MFSAIQAKNQEDEQSFYGEVKGFYDEKDKPLYLTQGLYNYKYSKTINFFARFVVADKGKAYGGISLGPNSWLRVGAGAGMETFPQAAVGVIMVFLGNNDYNITGFGETEKNEINNDNSYYAEGNAYIRPRDKAPHAFILRATVQKTGRIKGVGVAFGFQFPYAPTEVLVGTMWTKPLYPNEEANDPAYTVSIRFNLPF